NSNGGDAEEQDYVEALALQKVAQLMLRRFLSHQENPPCNCECSRPSTGEGLLLFFSALGRVIHGGEIFSGQQKPGRGMGCLCRAAVFWVALFPLSRRQFLRRLRGP